MQDQIYLGLKGHLVCLNRTNGRELWRTKLKRSDLTNIMVDGEEVFAYCGGRLFCVSTETGDILWQNDLPGLGYGYGILSSANAQAATAATAHLETQRRAASS